QDQVVGEAAALVETAEVPVLDLLRQRPLLRLDAGEALPVGGLVALQARVAAAIVQEEVDVVGGRQRQGGGGPPKGRGRGRVVPERPAGQVEGDRLHARLPTTAPTAGAAREAPSASRVMRAASGTI